MSQTHFLVVIWKLASVSPLQSLLHQVAEFNLVSPSPGLLVYSRFQSLLREVAAALAVIERVGRIKRLERDREYRRFTAQLTNRYAIVPLTTSDFATAADLTQRHPLKGYDAMQLAVALRYSQVLASPQITFVTSDNTLFTAAQAEGLSADNPASHVAPEDTYGRRI